MSKFFAAIITLLCPLVVFAQNETNYEIQSTKCSGTLQKDGSIAYKGDCPKTTRKNVAKKDLKKGDKVNSINNQTIDTPEKAMELFNKMKNDGATSISVDREPEQDTLKK